MMIEDLQAQHKIITKDIEHFENLSDEEFDIFENNIITNAYVSAKLQVQQKALREKKWRDGDSGRKKAKPEIKLMINGTET